jgi:hypothetical protein
MILMGGRTGCCLTRHEVEPGAAAFEPSELSSGTHRAVPDDCSVAPGGDVSHTAIGGAWRACQGRLPVPLLATSPPGFLPSERHSDGPASWRWTAILRSRLTLRPHRALARAGRTDGPDDEYAFADRLGTKYGGLD